MIVSRFFCHSNNSELYMLCIDNSHFFLLSFVIFANLYIQKILPLFADFSTNNSRFSIISATHTFFSHCPIITSRLLPVPSCPHLSPFPDEHSLRYNFYILLYCNSNIPVILITLDYIPHGYFCSRTL